MGEAVVALTMRPSAIAAILLAAAFPAVAGILGKKPGYLDAPATSFANEPAITPRIWAPGLDEGYAPQGLAVIGKYALVSSYQDAEPSRPRCRVFRIERDTGAEAGYFDMPEPCRHDGGIADIGGGLVVVADTRQVWRVDVQKALTAKTADGATRGMIKLPSGWGAAFVFFDGRDLWIGVYAAQKDAADAKIYRLDLGAFDRLDGQVLAPMSDPLEVVPIPPLAQGAALDRDGNLWMSASTSVIGRLYRIDRKSGAVLAKYDTITGIEGLSFDERGELWALSEAGSRKYMHWKQHFPLIFQVDVAKLK